MWIKSNDDTIRDFYNSIKEDYPNLKFEDVENIILSCFLYFRKIIEAGQNQIVHIKYFGKLIPKKSKLLTNITTNVNSIETSEDADEK